MTSLGETFSVIGRPQMNKTTSFRVSLLGVAAAAGEAAAADPAENPDRHVLASLDGPIVAERVLAGLSQPVAIEFLPDGKALILQRDRDLMSLVEFETGKKTDIECMPDMLVLDAAGAHDLELHPQYRSNGWIYVAYSEGEQYRIKAVVDCVRLDGTKVAERQRIFTADAHCAGLYSLAARLAFVDEYLFLALGDREHPPMAQDNTNHAGAVIRLHDDGRVPAENPFVGAIAAPGARPPRPEIWSYGHRDPEGLYRHPETGELWSHGHGPRGGDEINVIRKGANYGWPVVSYGFEYDGGPIGMGIPAQEGMETNLRSHPRRRRRPGRARLPRYRQRRHLALAAAVADPAFSSSRLPSLLVLRWPSRPRSSHARPVSAHLEISASAVRCFHGALRADEARLHHRYDVRSR